MNRKAKNRIQTKKSGGNWDCHHIKKNLKNNVS